MKRLTLAVLLCAGCGGLLPGGNDSGNDTDSGVSDAGNGNDGGTDGGFSCNADAGQPDLCAYGEYCAASVAKCRDVQVGTCSNFGSTHSTKSWNVTTSTGHILWDGVDEANDVQADCQTTQTPFTVTLKGYAFGSATFPNQKSNLPGFFYVNSTGTETDIPLNLLKQSNYIVSTDMKNATMTFTLCTPTVQTMITAGFYFTGGNPFCMTLNH